MEKLIGFVIKIIALFSNRKAAEVTFHLFQKTQTKKLTDKDRHFYESTEFYTISSAIEPINIYIKGPKEGELFILLHGWNSNIARLSDLVEVLVQKGYRCILFDMPGHGKSTLNRTNLKVNSIVFQTVLDSLDLTQPFNILTHSFGSMVSSYTLANSNYQINHLIYLTVLDRFEPIFTELKKRLGLSDAVYQLIVQKGEALLKEPIASIEMLAKTRQISFKQLSLFHDKHDKILPYAYSQKLNQSIPNSTLYSYEKIGHSRMLQNKALLADLRGLFEQ